MKRIIILAFIILAALMFRLIYINQVPSSLFGDELDVGYHAYSILKTGRDYTGHFLPLHFRSMAEWRTPLYLYSAVPTVALFGISYLGVRLPAIIFGLASIIFFYLLTQKLTKNYYLSLIGMSVLALSPWHIHYSRAGFEVTQMLMLMLGGIYFFLKGVESTKWLILSGIFLGLMPWSYNTAKFYLPVLLLILLLTWWKELLVIPKKKLLVPILCFAIITAPFFINTIFGGGTQRFNLISIYADPEMEGKIGFAREIDQITNNSFTSRLFHNKVTITSSSFINNYLQSFSPQFLFISGDPSPRHNSSGAGQLYVLEALFIILGIFFLFKNRQSRKIKLFILLWLLTAPIPSALTQGGGTHATRLILMLPPLVFLISNGLYYLLGLVPKSLKIYSFNLISIGYLFSVFFYLHYYYIHYPIEQAKWWHHGYEEVTKTILQQDRYYERVIISQFDEPSLLFFLAWSMYPPHVFQTNYPPEKTNFEKLGQVQKLGKYLFPEIGSGTDLYSLSNKISTTDLYVAPATEIKLDLIKEPQRLPADINLVRAITYPSGEAAFYIFSKK